MSIIGVGDGGVRFIKVQKTIMGCDYYLISLWEDVT
jgi:hypothetical protein